VWALIDPSAPDAPNVTLNPPKLEVTAEQLLVNINTALVKTFLELKVQ
jgi:hypothetical protein